MNDTYLTFIQKLIEVIDKEHMLKIKELREITRMVWLWSFRKAYDMRQTSQKLQKASASFRERDIQNSMV